MSICSLHWQSTKHKQQYPTTTPVSPPPAADPSATPSLRAQASVRAELLRAEIAAEQQNRKAQVERPEHLDARCSRGIEGLPAGIAGGANAVWKEGRFVCPKFWAFGWRATSSFG